MVTVSSKKLLMWYVTTLKLDETVRARVPNLQGPKQSQQQQQPPDSVLIQIDSWAGEINWYLKRAVQDDEEVAVRAKQCIYRIPSDVVEREKKAYSPQILFLVRSPRHFDPVRKLKWRCLHHILKRTNQDIELYLKSIKKLENRARACYEEEVDEDDFFVPSMVVNGCFVLELLQGATVGFEKLGYSRNDPIFEILGSMRTIQQDMMLLQNQLPLFILDRLLELQNGKPGRKEVAKLAVQFFNSFVRYGTAFDPLLGHSNELHFLDAVRGSLLRTSPLRSHGNFNFDQQQQQESLRSATKLMEVGIEFKKRNTNRLWDIKFNKGVLYIPELLINDGTKSLLLNFLAFEQRHPTCRNEIGTYAIFMANLINSPEDVAYLRYCGIIEHRLGSDAEVVRFFKHLCPEAVFNINGSYLSRLSIEVNEYYKYKPNAWRWSFKNNYCSNPWTIISLVAGVILLLLTATQTFYGVYAYYRPPS